jgi:hypothetical protein
MKTIYGVLFVGILTGLMFLAGFTLSSALKGGVTIDFERVTLQKYDSISRVGCKSDSMGLSLDCNDRLYMRNLKKNHTFTVGDIYIYQDEDSVVVHRLVKCLDDGCNKLIFKGDNNHVADPIINRSDVVSKVVQVEYR